MTRFASLLLPLDGSPESVKGLGCALWLTEKLHATLHIVHATAHPLPMPDTLHRLRIAQAQGARVVVHQVAGSAGQAVLDAVATHSVDLLIMSARGETASAATAFRRVGSVARSVITSSPVPVLLFPTRYRETVPWTSMLAAASGEAPADQALEAAVQLAAALCIKVTVLHCEDGPLTGRYADTAHHEYPHLLEDMLARGLAGSTQAECKSVGDVLLRQGDPAQALLRQVAQQQSSVLALGWHGEYGEGRCLVFKRLLEEATCALLLVRAAEGSSARLKVGKELDG